MKRTTTQRRGAWQTRHYQWWCGVAYPTNVARLRYNISDAIAPIFGEG